MVDSSRTLIIVGGGISGLTLAVAAQARGHVVTVVTRDDVADTASGVAAGMIAPALEALNDPEPGESYRRLRSAQTAWTELAPAWPPEVQQALRARSSSLYVWPQSDNTSDHVTPRLNAMGADYTPAGERDLAAVAADCNGVLLAGEQLVDAAAVLRTLQAQVSCRKAVVAAVTATSITLATAETLTADAVVIAAGYGAKAFAADVPALAHLAPVKGHILDVPGQGGFGVTRAPWGYFADYGATAKFGATMEFGNDDPAVNDTEAEGLKDRARQLMPGRDTSAAVARAGVRAASPDSWPMIGRDAASGVYVATAMRRNGYIFAPLAARLILDLIGGKTPPEAALYDPNRFS